MHKSSSMENNSCLLACRLYRPSGCVSWSLVIVGKRSHEMDRVKFWHTNKYGRGVCMSVSNPSKRWRVRLSIFTNTLGDLLGVTDIKRETVWPISTWVCRRDYICTRKPQPAKHSKWLLTSCSGDSCSMSAWRHLRPGRKWLPITSSEITAQEVKDQNEKLIQSSTMNVFVTLRTVGITMLTVYAALSAPSRKPSIDVHIIIEFIQ